MTDAGNETVRVVETHSAVVLLTGGRALKWKKAVDLGFLDFRDLDRREAACRRELELNRRLAPDVYLGLATLTDEDGAVVEHVLMMRRLPDGRRLSHLVVEGRPVDACLRSVARDVASLHARTVTPEAAPAAAATTLLGNWQDNLDVLRKHPAIGDADVERTAHLASSYLDGRGPLFALRSELACDGHGDLLADDIFCLDDGPRIIDCLDFSDAYRLGDPLLDAAFLAMDLERLGRPDLGTRFLGWYREFSGEPYPETLAHHYIAYRASVRAKVALLRAQQGDQAAPEQARRLHALCLTHLEAGQVPLVLVGGLPGSGKSTVAAAIADRLGCALLSSDVVRKERLGVDRASAAPEQAYTLEARASVYRELLGRAARLLGRGERVVLDASWLEPDWRDAAAGVARAAAASCLAIRCAVPLPVARQRLERRAAAHGSASDATPAVLDDLAGRASPWPEAQTLDTGAAPDEVAEDAVALVHRQLAGAPG